jgi:uncharacterized cupredoxin-like copper-binding protein
LSGTGKSAGIGRSINATKGQAMGKIEAAGIGLALLGLVAAAPASAAATSVNVSLTGEGTGQMGIAVDQASVPAGKVTFVVKNNATTESHEMVVIALPSPDAELPYDAAKQRVTESKVKSMGEVSDLKPGASKSKTLTLKPGSYKLICNMKGHYMAGMSAVLTVTK